MPKMDHVLLPFWLTAPEGSRELFLSAPAPPSLVPGWESSPGSGRAPALSQEFHGAASGTSEHSWEKGSDNFSGESWI